MTRVSHTPTLSNASLKTYLENDLANELHWLLRAALEWRIQNKIRLRIPGYHMQVYAMDSAFLHARTLFEFFTTRTTANHYGFDAYGVSMIPVGVPQVPTRYLSNNWNSALHAYLMHAQDRTVARRLTSFDGRTTKDIKKMPVDFAQEIVELWRNFAKQLGLSAVPDIKGLETVALDILKTAIDQTENVYTRKKVVGMKRRFPVNRIIW